MSSLQFYLIHNSCRASSYIIWQRNSITEGKCCTSLKFEYFSLCLLLSKKPKYILICLVWLTASTDWPNEPFSPRAFTHPLISGELKFYLGHCLVNHQWYHCSSKVSKKPHCKHLRKISSCGNAVNKIFFFFFYSVILEICSHKNKKKYTHNNWTFSLFQCDMSIFLCNLNL